MICASVNLLFLMWSSRVVLHRDPSSGWPEIWGLPHRDQDGAPAARADFKAVVIVPVGRLGDLDAHETGRGSRGDARSPLQAAAPRVDGLDRAAESPGEVGDPSPCALRRVENLGVPSAEILPPGRARRDEGFEIHARSIGRFASSVNGVLRRAAGRLRSDGHRDVRSRLPPERSPACSKPAKVSLCQPCELHPRTWRGAPQRHGRPKTDLACLVARSRHEKGLPALAESP